ncbi:hypothetical protein RJ641_014519 [Dillenia turbinata]|uniref:ABC transporter domain-containing protein n=1 Tax=Dillenia turbinata TaxID=194707 RepID=A0AAN8UZE8_9MAGN
MTASRHVVIPMTKDPKTVMASPIPPCENKPDIGFPCYDFAWSGNSSYRLQTIVEAIMMNNPGRPIPANKVMSFRTKAEVDDWVGNKSGHCAAALHLEEKNDTVISYGLQFATNADANLGGTQHKEDHVFTTELPLQIAAEREITRSLLGDPELNWAVGFKEFAHPREIYPPLPPDATLAPLFLLVSAMFGFMFQMSALTREKELKLRQAMTIMGLYDSAYWLSWLTWEAIIALLSSLFLVLFGMIFQLPFFLKNSFLVVFFTFFLFQLSMLGTPIIYTPVTSKNYRYILSLFPPNLFSYALNVLETTSSTSGISWQGRLKCPSGADFGCVITLNDVYKWFLSLFVGYFVLAIYLDNVVPNTAGVRKSFFYFLNPGYWTGRGGSNLIEAGYSVDPVFEAADDEDVIAEEAIVKQQVTDGRVDPNVAVQIRCLAKSFPGKKVRGCCRCCCCSKRSAPYHAVRGLWVNFEKDQLFCLLGPNGAGKTTTISCLTGITPVTGGDGNSSLHPPFITFFSANSFSLKSLHETTFLTALIYGNSIRSSLGMSNIRRIMGVCPQFDILWEEMSGEEHLHLFARIKGLPASSIKSDARKSLEEVRLIDAAKRRAGSYSGGMKRRLSVAIALIGDPKLVILDEPTTGMDPISRRHVWDIIQNAKRGRCIILTTHSMEEADILSDRIGIMAKGRLRCIGTSTRLKSRFGSGFIVNVSFTGSNIANVVTTASHEAVKQFFKYHLNVKPKEEHKAFLTFIVPNRGGGHLTAFFEELENRQRDLEIADIQISLTTLEEVFLNISRKAELQNALEDGRAETLKTTSGISVKVPVGARYVGIPGTETAENPRGLMVEVYWEEDESGALSISGQSREMPIPPNVPTMPQPRANPRRRLGRKGSVHGVVISPELI